MSAMASSLARHLLAQGDDTPAFELLDVAVDGPQAGEGAAHDEALDQQDQQQPGTLTDRPCRCRSSQAAGTGFRWSVRKTWVV